MCSPSIRRFVGWLGTTPGSRQDGKLRKVFLDGLDQLQDLLVVVQGDDDQASLFRTRRAGDQFQSFTYQCQHLLFSLTNGE